MLKIQNKEWKSSCWEKVDIAKKIFAKGLCCLFEKCNTSNACIRDLNKLKYSVYWRFRHAATPPYGTKPIKKQFLITKVMSKYLIHTVPVINENSHKLDSQAKK